MNMTFQGSKDYVASDELMRSVNIAKTFADKG